MEIPPYREPGCVGDLWGVAVKEEGGWELKGLQGLRRRHEVQDRHNSRGESEVDSQTQL